MTERETPMMPNDTPQTRDNSPLSWRDVYRALGETEARILAAINQAVLPIAAGQADHEARLRSIEAAGTPRVQRLEQSVTALHARLDVIERREDVMEGRERGILATLNGAQKTVLLVSAIGGIAWVIVQIIDKVAV